MENPMTPSCSTATPQSASGDLGYLHHDAVQWHEPRGGIDYASPEESIVLFGGLTPLKDRLLLSAIRRMKGRYIALPTPDNEAFRLGKSYGNRGQCNPTYFTSGNLIKYLQELEHDGLTREEIVRTYVFATASGCGPCRFGMYTTEYRKALETAGFGGLRIETFEQQKGIFQMDESQRVAPFSPRFFVHATRAVSIGDMIDIMGYQMRPYEVESGSVDRAMAEAEVIISEALTRGTSLLRALYRSRRLFARIALDRTQVKPRVMVMGEFWAAMTEGDGNYHLHRFLESEGAEVIPQPLINRFLMSLWEAKHDRDKHIALPDPDRPLLDFSPIKDRLLIEGGKWIVKGIFTLYARTIGLRDYTLPNMEKLYELARNYYPVDSDGGEGHLEVAHVIEAVEEDLAELIISVKPFGCMPSSAVSDGIQTLVTARYPQVNFLSIETSGEGAANFYSRVQMALFKAKEAAKKRDKNRNP
jgi:predicted nucleotide-binding protein (sugar kinase/HSP70/actin superfamily)